ncbi:MAG: hypothetical protein J1E61_02390 [Lachnospiraceae bacterium]|nr:hypothetical protein [Lachnospiraceae bacterium]
MQNIVTEIKKSLYLPFFILSCFGVVLVCLLSEGYTSLGGKSYTIMELLLFLSKDTMLTDVSLNRYEIWMKGIGTWTQLLLPFLLSIGYLYDISNEKLTGMHRLILVRENNLGYCISKTISAMLSGGIIMFVGYAIFGAIIFIKFPSIQEYPVDYLNMYMESFYGFQEFFGGLKRCIGIFLYGMCINIFAYFVSIIFVDKYILLCLPIMMKYIWGQTILKIEMNAINTGQDALLNLCSGLRIENILSMNQSVFWWMTLLLVFVIYMGGFCLNLYLLKKKGSEVGFE